MTWERRFDVITFSVVGLVCVGLLVYVFAQPLQMGIADQVEDALPVTVHVYKRQVCQGSGCIISPDGIVFTAKHVTDNEYGEYEVTLNDGRTFGVRAVIEDKNYDIAFLQLDLPEDVELSYARLADISELRVGDPLFIIGSPFGRENFNSVSLGILSAIQRDLGKYDWGYGWEISFQSTSPAFPGNSGGPVFNLQGEVIGVLVANVIVVMLHKSIVVI